MIKTLIKFAAVVLLKPTFTHATEHNHERHAEKHDNGIGLSVPGMPVDSTGIKVGERFMPYNVLILFIDGSSKIYEKVNAYEEQF